jgi:phospholipase D1/2
VLEVQKHNGRPLSILHHCAGILLARRHPEQYDMNQLVWLRVFAARVIAGLIVCALVLAVWMWTPVVSLDLDDVSSQLATLRDAWYALPVVMLAFVVLAVLPVVLLIAATGLAFGPMLGPLYAMAGCLASASAGFAIGRWMGQRRVERLGGERIARLSRALRRNGTLAVFFVRKVPAPFTLANIVVGASSIRYRDFILGTLLGMGAFVVALAGFGYQFTKALHDPSPATWIAAALFIGVPLTLAWLINRMLGRSRPVA